MCDEYVWLNDLAEGDIVAIPCGFADREYRLERVTKVTQTQIVVGRTRYRKLDGREIGVGLQYRTCIVRATPEIRHQAKEGAIRNRLLVRVINMNPHKLPIDQLRKICNILDEHDKCSV